jgi:hypothetical protein
MVDEAPSTLENMRTQMDRAQEYAQVTENIFRRMKHPDRTLQEVNADLERRLTDAFEELVDAYSSYETPDLRTAAYTIALDRNATAHAHRGLFP